MIAHIKALWYNPPRRRRFCAKSLFDWHDLFAVLTDVCVHLAPLVSVAPEEVPLEAQRVMFC